MRILSVGNRYPPWSFGGYETIWQRANGAFRAAGHEVRVLSTAPDPTDQAGTPEPDVHRDLRWYWRAHAFPPRRLRACVGLERANAAALAGHLRGFRPDAIVWWAMGGMSLSLLEHARRAGIPALGVVGDQWMLYGPDVDCWISRWRGWRRPAAPLAQRLTGLPAHVDLDRGARWVFISAHLLEATRASGPALPGALVAHPGIDPGRFAPSPPGEWGWRLLYCGRVDPRKGVATAVRALTELPAQATLTVDGSGDQRHLDELRALAGRLDVGARVRFTRTATADIAAVYAAADALVFPVDWKEPWGLVPLEAMAVGRPVLASRAGGGPSEYLSERLNCLQFDPEDAGGLAAAVNELASTPELRAALVDGGRATAARFTEAAFHAVLVDELTRLLGASLARTRRHSRTGAER